MGLGYALSTTTLLVTIVKLVCGSLRPHFFHVCGSLRVPDHSQTTMPIWLSVTTQCTGDPRKVKEAQMSFPSGHAASSFAGFGFLALFLNAKFKTFGPRRHSGMPRRRASGIEITKFETICTRTIMDETIWIGSRPCRFRDLTWPQNLDTKLPEDTPHRQKQIQHWKLLLFLFPWVAAGIIGVSKILDG